VLAGPPRRLARRGGWPARQRKSAPGWRGDGRTAEYGSGVGSGLRLTVLGSLNMDISVTVPRLPGLGATVLGSGAAYAPGGKGANQAVAASRLGAAVRMVGCVGDDDFGGRLRAALRDEGVADEGVRTVSGTPTGLAMITVDAAGENMITVAPGANREVGPEEIAVVRATAADVLVISAEIPVAAIKAALAENGPELRVLNLAPAPPEAAELLAAGVDWLVVNESEAGAVLGMEVTSLRGAAAAAAELAAMGARNVVVTAGAAGAAYHSSGAIGGVPAREAASEADGTGVTAVTVPGFNVRAVDSVGAGDTFVGALAVALAAGVVPGEAVRAAAAAGAAAATRPGTQSGMPRPADVLAATGLTWPVS
jgi:ribokinase